MIVTIFLASAIWMFKPSSAWGQVPVPSVVVQAPPTDERTVEDIIKKRYPFKKPDLLARRRKNGDLASELEQIPVQDFKMVGVVTGPTKLKAMILAPNGKTYFVSERDRIGVNKGVIRKITAESIVVREKVLNLLGKEEDIFTEIALPPDNAKGG